MSVDTYSFSNFIYLMLLLEYAEAMWGSNCSWRLADKVLSNTIFHHQDVIYVRFYIVQL
jgi:hypothetical protein